MQIGDIVQLDQNNRLRIPKNVLKAAGIDENSEVLVNIELGTRVITIRSIYAIENFIKENDNDTSK